MNENILPDFLSPKFERVNQIDGHTVSWIWYSRSKCPCSTSFTNAFFDVGLHWIKTVSFSALAAKASVSATRLLGSWMQRWIFIKIRLMFYVWTYFYRQQTSKPWMPDPRLLYFSFSFCTFRSNILWIDTIFLPVCLCSNNNRRVYTLCYAIPKQFYTVAPHRSIQTHERVTSDCLHSRMTLMQKAMTCDTLKIQNFYFFSLSTASKHFLLYASVRWKHWSKNITSTIIQCLN